MTVKILNMMLNRMLGIRKMLLKPSTWREGLVMLSGWRVSAPLGFGGGRGLLSLCPALTLRRPLNTSPIPSPPPLPSPHPLYPSFPPPAPPFPAPCLARPCFCFLLSWSSNIFCLVSPWLFTLPVHHIYVHQLLILIWLLVGFHFKRLWHESHNSYWRQLTWCSVMQRNLFQCIVFSTVQCKALRQCNVRSCDSGGSTLPLVKVTVLSLAYNTIRPCAQRRRHSSKLNVNIGDNAVTTLAPRSWIHIVRSLTHLQSMFLRFPQVLSVLRNTYMNS